MALATKTTKKKNLRTHGTVFDRAVRNPAEAAMLRNAMNLKAGYSSAQQALDAVFKQQGMAAVYKDVPSLVPAGVSIYGRNSIFDPCTAGDIIGLQVETHGLMQWLGWRPNKFYRRRVDFILWWGPSGTADGSPVSFAGAPCNDPNSWEYGAGGYELLHKSWYHSAGEALDPHTIVQERCETSPRYRLNGVMIADDVEWQVHGSMNALQQNIRRDLVYGSHDNAYEMAGLTDLVKTGYDDGNGHLMPQVDSIIVAWNNDDLDGVVNNNGNFFEYLDEVVTEIEWRSSGLGTIAESDMILLTSRFMATCLLDSYACYTTCGVTDSNDITDQALRAQQRAERRSLNGGPLYDGRNAVGFIHLKSGRRLPIIVEDTIDVHKGSGSNYCTDIRLLTRRIGSMDVLYGEYLDLRVYENRIKAQYPEFGVRTDAAGRFVFRGKEDNWCIQTMTGTSPEIFLSAPWAQAVFTDVCCSRKRQPLLGDPYQPQYLPGGNSLYPAYSFE